MHDENGVLEEELTYAEIHKGVQATHFCNGPPYRHEGVRGETP